MNLAAEMSKLPEPKTDKRPPEWAYWRHDLWIRAQRDAPHNFMKWPCVYHTMLQDHWRDSIEIEAKYVSDRIDQPVILPQMLIAKDAYPLSSWYNLVHQTYHLIRWQEATGLSIADMQSIYEFGGGYGAMALVCNRLGFKGKYYIYDLPEFALLQQWYLEECGVENVEWVDGLDTTSVDLLIACYSLSETDYTERDRFLTRTWAKSYLFLYSNKFEDYDNIWFFQRQGLDRHLYGHQWAHSHIEHLPPESWYTFGWPNARQPF